MGSPDPQPPVRVLVVDDSEPFRDVAREVIVATPGLDWVGAARSGEEAVEAVERLAPRLVVMDKRMRGIGGIEAARRIRAGHPNVIVILMSVETPRLEALEASGAHAFVHKRELSPRMLAQLWHQHGN